MNNKNTIARIKERYVAEDIVMSELLRSDEFFGLSREEKEELLAWSGDDEFLAVTKEGEIVVLADLTQVEKREILFPKAVAYYSKEADVDGTFIVGKTVRTLLTLIFGVIIRNYSAKRLLGMNMFMLISSLMVLRLIIQLRMLRLLPLFVRSWVRSGNL